MSAARNTRRLLLASVFSLGVFACADTDIESPGATTPPASPPPTTSPPPPPPPPTGTTVTLASADDCAAANAGGATLVPLSIEVPGLTDVTAELCGIEGLTDSNAAGGVLPAGTIFPAGVPILLRGVTRVGEDIVTVPDSDDAANTLTIEAGATIVGAAGEDVLVVTRGSQILANGAADNPIVFTSLTDITLTAEGTPRDGSDATKGEWGGLVINGQAPINDCNPAFVDDPDSEGGTASCQKFGEGESGLFGGDIADDSSGVLRYVQVKYAGNQFTTQNELNGIAFQGVGNGVSTEAAALLGAGDVPFEFLQVHNNDDDGVEFFGGTVNARYIVLTGNDDDSLDWTDGWKGNVQYVLIEHRNGGDNGFEGDNREGAPTREPVSRPTIANVTFLGDDTTGGRGMRLREGTGALIANSVFVNPVGDCMRADAEQEANVLADILNLESVEFSCPNGGFSDDSDADADNESQTLFDQVSPFFVDPELVDGEVTGNSTPTNTNLLVDATSLAETYFPGPTELGVDVLNLTITGNSVDNADGDGAPGPTGVSAAFIAEADGFDATFFDAADYIGAFGPEDQPGDNWTTGWTFGIEETSDDPVSDGCPAGTITTADTIADANGEDKPVCRLQGTLTSDVTLTADNVYQLNEVVRVGEDAGPTNAGGLGDAATSAVLTIEPGTTIYGVNGPDLLVVNRGSQIIANGTAEAPIVFTSDEDLLGTVTNSTRGQFGGLVINGLAPINDCSELFPESCVKSGEGNSGFFGGTDADDASGVLRYVQVRYAGFQFTTQNELNGIAFQGVGRGVSDEAAAVLADGEVPFEFIQVHNNDDDGIEFFGGTANARYLVLTGNDDDSLDWTDGWKGNVQYVIIQQGNGGGDNGFEGDNREGDPTLTPQSSPSISNITITGGLAADDTVASDTSDAMRLREGTAGIFANVIIDGIVDQALQIDAEQQTNIDAGTLILRSAFIDAAEVFGGDDGDTTPATTMFGADANNTTGTSTLGDNTDTAFFTGGLGVVPTAGGAESLVTPFDITAQAADADAGFDPTFFDTPTFIGAVDPDAASANNTWYQGWTLVSGSLDGN